MPRRKKSAVEAEMPKSAKKNEKLPKRLLGMKDFSKVEQACFDLALKKAEELANTYSFTSIKIPVLESFDLYKKSFRQISREKDIYFVDGDKGEKAVLRPEMTQGMLRSYLENNPEPETKVARLFSIGPVFRRQKLQSGKYRESNRFNLEVLGVKKPMSEAILILIAVKFFEELGVDVQVQINSLGDALCRKDYCSKLNNFYKERGIKSKLCNACKNGLTKNCLSLLTCQEDTCVKLREEAPQIADCLSDESRDYLEKTLEILDELGVNYNFNPYLVRDFNYYNDIVFDFWPVSEKGVASSFSLGGGGRYDNLVESLGAAPISACGLSIAIERTIARIKDKASLTKNKEEDIVFIAQLGDQAKLKALKLSSDLIKEGFKVRQSPIVDSLKLQIEEASKMNASVCLILGKKEIMDNTVLMRDLESGAQETLVFNKIKNHLIKRLSK